jgi:hypothetical protein
VSRWKQALAATAMAIPAAGGGLLIAAAGAAPAYASAPPGGHAITVTVHRAGHAASRIGPHDILPCAQKPGAAPADTCGGESISCILSAGSPFVNFATREVRANAIVQCTDDVIEIRLTEHLLRSGVSVATDSVIEPDSPVALTQVATACQLGTYINVVDAVITPPSGYVLTGGSRTPHFESTPLQVLPTGCIPDSGGGGGGGGGGCAVHAPSLASDLAGRHPDLITCR